MGVHHGQKHPNAPCTCWGWVGRLGGCTPHPRLLPARSHVFFYPTPHPVQVRHPFNAQHEKERKRGLELLMQRSREQDEAENEILQQAAQIEAKRKAEAAARRAAAGPAAASAPGSSQQGPAAAREVRSQGRSSMRCCAVRHTRPSHPHPAPTLTRHTHHRPTPLTPKNPCPPADCRAIQLG